MSTSFPEYEHPPLDEVVMGLQFESLAKFSAAYAGLYWSRIRDNYPLTQDQPPLPHMMEQNELNPEQQQIRLIAGTSPIRSWFLNKSQTELIQVQPDRFLRNWRQVTGNEVYPRFVNLIKRFREQYAEFRSFVETEGIGSLKINQVELTYINNIELESAEKLGDLSGVLTLFKRSPSSFLPVPEVLSGQARYTLPQQRGRLHVEINPAFRGRDMKLILSLNMTARGAPSGQAEEQIFEWFEMAHEWIVRGFDGLTDPAMHRLWEKKS